MRFRKKQEFEEQLDKNRKKLYDLQTKIKEHRLPVLVLFEGWAAAGKGSVIGKVIKNIDPRFFKVATMTAPSEEEKRKPFFVPLHEADSGRRKIYFSGFRLDGADNRRGSEEKAYGTGI